MLSEGDLRERYYNDIIHLFRALRTTLRQLEHPHDKSVEETLVKVLKELVKMMTFIDKTLLTENTNNYRRDFHQHLQLFSAFPLRFPLEEYTKKKVETTAVRSFGDLGDEMVSNGNQTRVD